MQEPIQKSIGIKRYDKKMGADFFLIMASFEYANIFKKN